MEYLLDSMLEYDLYYEYKDKFAQIYGYKDWEEAQTLLTGSKFTEFEHIYETERFYYYDWVPTSFERLRKVA